MEASEIEKWWSFSRAGVYVKKCVLSVWVAACGVDVLDVLDVLVRAAIARNSPKLAPILHARGARQDGGVGGVQSTGELRAQLQLAW